MIEQDALTDFRWAVQDHTLFSVDLPDGEHRVRAYARYRGVLVYADSYCSDELLADPVPLESYLRRNILRWARENWPPEPPKE